MRGCAVGTLIGALPGAGADIAAWMSYAICKKFSKEPEKFGTGHVEGIVDSGSANNSALGGAWIPALVFGIPGDSITAIVIGVLYMKNMNPGPTLFRRNPRTIYAVFLLFILANLIMLPLGWLCIKVAKRILRVPRDILMPVILLFCIVGAFAINNSAFDVGVMLVAGVVAWMLEENGFPITPLILGVVLGEMLEENFISSMIKADGNVLALLQPADRRRARRADDRDLALAAAAAAPPPAGSGHVSRRRAHRRRAPARAAARADRTIGAMQTHAVDSRYAWRRLVVALALMTIGSSAMYVVAVVLPAVQAEFGVARADASLPYTLLMIGFGVGGIFMGRLADRCGIVRAAPDRRGRPRRRLRRRRHGAAASGPSRSPTACCSACSAARRRFAPLVADTSLWFERRRGIAVAICASGNYLAGAIWPPIVQHFVETRRLAPDLHRPRHLLRR